MASQHHSHILMYAVAALWEWLLLAWVLCIPLPYVAVEAGWIVREVGRQPWVVYGLLRTSQAASTVAPSCPKRKASSAR